MSKYNCLVIYGTTASGKTRAAVELAARLNGVVLSADSRQVYRHLQLGSGKDVSEYQNQGNPIPYRLIDIVDPGSRFTLNDYLHAFYAAFNEVVQSGKLPIICGGTALYIEQILRKNPWMDIPESIECRSNLGTLSDYDLQQKWNNWKQKIQFDSIKHLKADTRKRIIRAIEIASFVSENGLPSFNYPDIQAQILCTHISREERHERIHARLLQRFEQGMLEEVQQLLQQGISPDWLIQLGLEYAFITKYILGQTNYQTMVQNLEIAIRQFSKRQMTWQRRFMTYPGATALNLWVDAINTD